MNRVIEQLLQHRSIRKFKPGLVTDEQVRWIIGAAQAASTSSNIQAYSVIGVTDPERKQSLAEAAGNQKHVAQCPLFLVWCADMYRLELAVNRHAPGELHQNTETFLLASVDAALAAQNAAVAAESLGLGIVYIGGIRNNPDRVAELLGLPRLVYPVFGMCVGIPDHSPDIRPRLPLDAVYHQETYDAAGQSEAICQYDETMKAYYSARTGGSRLTEWSKEMASRMEKDKLREHMYAHLEKQGFRLR
ncbi:oxygen-insensitive NADPH nitroreductase [Paenibacillus sp. GCM10027626]|uniref:oxygen-insensitive NADPH nitroreductase n=1 Tax=Paenibacillus sp. GCM10027626 TaxID=3273411 RepID=UPI0036251261